MSIELKAAKALIAAAQEHSIKMDRPITAAVVDGGGFVVAVERMEGTRLLTPQIAMAKAYTAVVMQRPSSMLKGWAYGEPVFFNQVARMGHQPIVATKGGIPIKKNGQIIGGLGIAGGTADDDQELAENTLKAQGYELDFVAFNRVKK